MSNKVHNAFLKDAYHKWKKRVKAAEHSVVVFSPYFDRNLVSLLKNTQIEFNQVKVITDFRPVTSLDYPKQLKAALALLEMGVDVRMLPRLHAKVLWTDHSYAVIGSQNFTTYSRNSKEISVALSEDLSDSKLSALLEEWIGQSEKIDSDFLNDLLELIEEPQKDLKKIVDKMNEAWTIAEERSKDRNKIQLTPLLQELIDKSEFTYSVSWTNGAKKGIYLRTKYVPYYENWEGSYSGSYYTLMVVGRDLSLTALSKQRSSKVEPPEVWGKYWPIIFPKTGRMIFGRIVQTRITYFRDNVNNVSWPRFREGFDGLEIYEARIDLPSTGKNNIEIAFRGGIKDPDSSQFFRFRFKAGFRFNGKELTFIGGETTQGSWIAPFFVDEILNSYCHANPEYIFKHALSGFKYESGGQLWNKNASETLEEELGTDEAFITAITYAGQPVFVIEEGRDAEFRMGI